MVACLCLLALRAGIAQTPSIPFSQSLAATSGVTFAQHLDASASPIPFTGTGVDGRLRYEHIGTRWDATIAADAARRIYASSADAGTSVRERSFDGSLTATLLRDFLVDSRSAFGAGVSLDLQGGLLTHHYADPAATTTDFVSAYALVGPAVRYRRRVFGGIANVHFGVPLFGVAHHPYTDVRIDEASPSLHLVSPSTLRGYDTGIGFESSLTRRVGLIAELRSRALNYADTQRAHSASTALSAGIIMRFGRTGR
ncbi:MAG: hypothetical protein ACREPM_20600 [Gemmatimonadaceae bacterium]